MAYPRTCDVCDVPFDAKFPHQKRCSKTCIEFAKTRYARSRDQSLSPEQWETRHRYCRWCGQKFQRSGRESNNRRYCSTKCEAAGYKARQYEFHERNPGKRTEYNRRRVEKHGPDTLLTRLYRRYPDLPTACESCGEARVLDLAHKPDHARRGAHRTLRCYQRYMFWILCPTCHALVDRKVCRPDDLGLEE